MVGVVKLGVERCSGTDFNTIGGKICSVSVTKSVSRGTLVFSD